MPKTEANTRPDNRDVKQARLQKREAMSLFKRRLAKLSDTNLTKSEIKKQTNALKEEYLKMIEPFDSILDVDEKKSRKRIAGKAASDAGFSLGRSTNRVNSKSNTNSADSPGKGSDEPITKRNKGGLIKTGVKDYRKGGMFY